MAGSTQRVNWLLTRSFDPSGERSLILWHSNFVGQLENVELAGRRGDLREHHPPILYVGGKDVRPIRHRSGKSLDGRIRRRIDEPIFGDLGDSRQHTGWARIRK